MHTGAKLRNWLPFNSAFDRCGRSPESHVRPQFLQAAQPTVSQLNYYYLKVLSPQFPIVQTPQISVDCHTIVHSILKIVSYRAVMP